jgi:hypothetical protein
MISDIILRYAVANPSDVEARAAAMLQGYIIKLIGQRVCQRAPLSRLQ